MTPELANLIVSRADAGTLRDEAMRSGMEPMLSDGIHKASEGLTSLEEVLRVVDR